MTKEVEEGNALIAKFMGAKECGNGRLLEFPPDSRPEGFDNWHRSSLKYDRDWNWIMPVVDRIEGMGGYEVLIDKGHVSIWSHWGSNPNISLSEKADTRIKALWGAVVKFIEEYNKHTAN